MHPRWVVTARNCFPDATGPGQTGAVRRPAQPTTAIVARTNLSTATGRAVPVVGLLPHPDRDVMLLKLASRVTGVPPLKIATNPPATGETLRVAGYGRTNTEWVPDLLHTATFVTQNVTPSTLDLTGTTPQASICKGDAGGPAFRETPAGPELVALNHTSWQHGCFGETGTRQGATETRVDTLAAWIGEHTGRTTTFPAPAMTGWGVPGDIPVRGDYNGDGTSDFVVFRPTTGQWWVKYHNGTTRPAFTWGTQGDIAVPGDYNGDGIDDHTMYRPSTGEWWVMFHDGTTRPKLVGAKGDVPVPGDYNGDGIDDHTVYRPSTGEWRVMYRDGTTRPAFRWGTKGDIPVPGDYNGDGIDDHTVYRPSTGEWWVMYHDGTTRPKFATGGKNDVPIPGDYNGDGIDDHALYRTGQWRVRLHDGTDRPAFTWGVTGDVPVPGDYNDDALTDYTVFRPAKGQWWVHVDPAAAAQGAAPGR